MHADDAYSFSRVTTFEQCARRFRYRYLDGVKEAFRGVEAFMGQQVHAAVEWLFSERDRGATHTAEEAVAWYCAQWDSEMAAAAGRVRVVKSGTDMELYRRTGAGLVDRFHHERFVCDSLDTVATEKHFQVTLDNGYRFQGYIDRLARDAHGVLHVIDYKTGKRTPSEFSGKEADQLRAYAIGIFAETGADELELVLEFLRAGKTLRRRIDREDASTFGRGLADRITAVEDSTVFPPQPGVLCDWCGYNDICEAYGGRVAAAARA